MLCQNPLKYTFPESSWAGLHAIDLPTPLRHPSVVCQSVKVLAIVIFCLSLPPGQPLRNVRSSHHSRKLSSRTLERLFGRSSTCRQRGVIAVCDGGAGTIRKRLELLELQLGSSYQNRYTSSSRYTYSTSSTYFLKKH